VSGYSERIKLIFTFNAAQKHGCHTNRKSSKIFHQQKLISLVENSLMLPAG
jgi:hypothetical protein